MMTRWRGKRSTSASSALRSEDGIVISLVKRRPPGDGLNGTYCPKIYLNAEQQGALDALSDWKILIHLLHKNS